MSFEPLTIRLVPVFMPAGVAMNVMSKAAKHSAPGQYLGFALQPVRLCYHLLTCPKGALVSLEHLDDVAVHYADGALMLEQTKSALKQNPISDWADDLWKTIANWVQSMEAGDIAASNTDFQLYVTPAWTGEFAVQMSRASNSTEVDLFLTSLKASLKKLKKKPACTPFMQ